MANVDFEEQNWSSSDRNFQSERGFSGGSKMGNLIIKIGLAKTSSQANTVLILLIIGLFAVAGYFVWSATKSPKASNVIGPAMPLPGGVAIPSGIEGAPAPSAR